MPDEGSAGAQPEWLVAREQIYEQLREAYAQMPLGYPKVLDLGMELAKVPIPRRGATRDEDRLDRLTGHAIEAVLWAKLASVATEIVDGWVADGHLAAPTAEESASLTAFLHFRFVHSQRAEDAIHAFELEVQDLLALSHTGRLDDEPTLFAAARIAAHVLDASATVVLRDGSNAWAQTRTASSHSLLARSLINLVGRWREVARRELPASPAELADRDVGLWRYSFQRMAVIAREVAALAERTDPEATSGLREQALQQAAACAHNWRLCLAEEIQRVNAHIGRVEEGLGSADEVRAYRASASDHQALVGDVALLRREHRAAGLFLEDVEVLESAHRTFGNGAEPQQSAEMSSPMVDLRLEDVFFGALLMNGLGNFPSSGAWADLLEVGRDTNCQRAVVAGLAWSSGVFVPAGVERPRTADGRHVESIYEQVYGGAFEDMADAAGVLEKLVQCGPGAKGVVSISRPSAPGHVLVAEYVDEAVRFCEYQHGNVKGLEGSHIRGEVDGTKYRFLVTHSPDRIRSRDEERAIAQWALREIDRRAHECEAQIEIALHRWYSEQPDAWRAEHPLDAVNPERAFEQLLRGARDRKLPVAPSPLIPPQPVDAKPTDPEPPAIEPPDVVGPAFDR